MSEPPVEISACRAAAVAVPKVNAMEVSPDEMVASVAITVAPRSSWAEPPVASPAIIVAVAARSVFVLLSFEAIAVPPTPTADSAVGADGATESTTIALFAPSDPAAPGAGTVNVALLPATSFIDPPLTAKAEADCSSRSADMSPACTVYRNVTVLVPEPLRYADARSVVPVSRSSDGIPAADSTFTNSLKVTVTSITAPTP